MKCPYCMEEIMEGAKKCKHCGEFLDKEMKQESNIPSIPEKNKTVALILCFFLWGFGIHCFYLWKIGKGILYLLTWWLLLIGVLVDFIMMLLCKEEDFEEKFCK